MAVHKVQPKQPRLKRAGERPGRIKEVRNLEVWDRCGPVRLAGCDDDPGEPHIFRGID
ncbi:hypothetical protein HEK616_44890 [Streptomyces nigrescens]|uniref:Uncharacterized protein n=3 Tax=Streptomyces TaxID=1883 RepID=A0ABY6PKF2_9ACTN|nr:MULTISPECIES: hypothetical protein [Streptomyces]MEE4425285.1 hypothetical protein [Streptomyces sp. DSM 41528]UZJ34281.1 hypothetical protein OJ254_27020 [Streptomyces endophytica]BDM71002.1 hypothetical protein HEK616_44890 [Streptomyces nigrescens]